MRSLVLILEGAADQPVEQLDGRTPLQAAHTPALDGVARAGRLGLSHLVPAGWAPQAEVSLLSCLGYDPKQYPCGRAALEAAAIGLECGPRDQALRCSFVTIVDGVLRDVAPRLGRRETATLIDVVRAHGAPPNVELFPLGGHRALAILRDAGSLTGLHTRPPSEALDQPVRAVLPAGRGARMLKNWMNAAQDALAECELNSVRRDLGENPVTGIWLWGQGPRPRLPMFRDRFGVGATAISGNALFRGLARVARIETPAPNAGDESIPIAAVRAAAVAALERQEMVIVHSAEADAAGHAGDAVGKVAALERLEAEVVAPLLESLQSRPDWRLLILTAHATHCATRRHAGVATPFALAGAQIESNRGDAFDELHAAQGEIRLDRGCDLMEYFLRT